MNMKRTSIADALAAMHNAAQREGNPLPVNVKDANDKTGEGRKLTVAEKRERDAEARLIRQRVETFGYFDKLSENRREGLVEIGLACADEHERRISFRSQFALGVVHLFPNAGSIVWETYKHAVRFVRYTFGNEPARILREEMRALCEHYDMVLPTAGKKTTGGVQGLTPFKAAQGLRSSVDALIERVNKTKRLDVTARTLKRLMNAAKEMDAAIGELEQEAAA